MCVYYIWLWDDDNEVSMSGQKIHDIIIYTYRKCWVVYNSWISILSQFIFVYRIIFTIVYLSIKLKCILLFLEKYNILFIETEVYN